MGEWKKEITGADGARSSLSVYPLLVAIVLAVATAGLAGCYSGESVGIGGDDANGDRPPRPRRVLDDEGRLIIRPVWMTSPTEATRGKRGPEKGDRLLFGTERLAGGDRVVVCFKQHKAAVRGRTKTAEK